MDTRDYTSHRKLYAYELRRLREAQGLSKSQFAAMVGVSRRYLIKLESAKASPTLEMMERIAAGFGIAVRDMVDFDTIGLRMATDNGPGTVDMEWRG